MSQEEETKWNKAYREGRFSDELTQQRSVTIDWAEPSLPKSADILDIGCGLLRNSRSLAELGHHVLAVDVAEEAFRHASPLPQTVTPLVKDLDTWSPPEGTFDLVIMVHYMNRHLLEDLVRSLKKGGYLALEVRAPLPEETTGTIPFYWLQPGELPTLFPSLEVVKHWESGIMDKKTVRALLKRS